MGKMWNNNKDGVYECVCCGRPLLRFDCEIGCEERLSVASNEPIDEKAVTIASDKKKIEWQAVVTRTSASC